MTSHKNSIVISGQVLHGQKYGRALGFPTANLDRRSFSRRKMKIRLGVWSGYVVIGKGSASARAERDGLKIKDKEYTSAIVIGPLDKHHLPKIEAHLLNFNGNLYGKKIIISLQKYIRPFKKFKNEAALKRQIANDLLRIK